MDLRDIVRGSPECIVGHVCVDEPLNFKRESRRFQMDPLTPLLEQLDDGATDLFQGDTGRYLQAQRCYAGAITRALEYISVARQWEASVRYASPTRISGDPRRRRIRERYRDLGPYMELTFIDIAIHACILLDRTITLSRRFLPNTVQPSFTSFRKHRDALANLSSDSHAGVPAYAAILASTADWYDIPLRVFRDKYIMHSAERHRPFFGWSSKHDLDLWIIIPAEVGQTKLLEKVKGANVKECTLHFYPMDVELLFSRAPFVEASEANFSSVRPALSKQIEIRNADAWVEIKLPDQFASKNVMVEALAAGVRRSQAYYARLNSGKVQFFKDGYSDLRDRFDYVSLNNNEIDSVEKLSTQH